MFKIIRLLALVVVVVIVLAIGAVYLSLDGLVKRIVEREGTAQLNVPTTLGSASLGLLQGTVNLKDLALGSPAGFTAPQMFSVAGLSVDTGGVTHLRDKPIRVADIQLDAPHLVIEQHGTTLNFKQLLAGLPNHGASSPTPSTDGDANPVRLIIDTLAINNATVDLIPDAGGLASGALDRFGGLGQQAAKLADKQLDKNVKPMTVTLPSLTVRNIGNADGQGKGAEIKDVATAVIEAMAAAAAKSENLPIDPALLTGNLDAVKGKVGSQVQGQLDKLPGGAGGLLNGVLGGKK